MKKLIHRILLATDFSPFSARTFHLALLWADACDAVLDIFHVIPILHEAELDSAVANLHLKEQKELFQSKLEGLVSQGKKKLPEVHSHLLEGIPADAITEFAVSSQADLVITGTHGWTGVNRVMMGSVAERVICQAPCPVLSMHDVEPTGTTSLDEAGRDGPYSPPRHILLPVDFSDCSLDAYEYAVNLEKSFETSVTLIHSFEPFSYSLDFSLAHPAEDRQHRENVKGRLADLTKAFTREGLNANYVIKRKPAAEAIIETLTETGADLIVMGTHGHQGLRRLIMGNVAAAVLRQSPVPVLTVKSPKFKHDSQKSPTRK
ncbi:MAG: universal stress protein [Nitrospirales bacterium]|nr:MAG: universal stress protein [Nitrospirales bacterium]